ncbi:hypothetical protein GCM10009865_41770 [Aeromicrobium ponti]|uniref:SSD domain-containing protein n=1 Tax=Cytobacillus oceanisediminis TaxID=665099 RepID=A0A562JIK8_9BACI|nr:MMPL family transporter [Cytobacillus oceanisediminis]TWH83022.1 hypothetical protein IQ19_04004 [Cytobacillus oceanisediminis]
MNKQVQSRAKKSLYQTTVKMTPAVMTALIATALGFISLYTSPVPMIQDFGKMLTVGMVVSFFVGVFLLLPILFARDSFFGTKEVRSQTTREGNSKTEALLTFLTRKFIKWRWLILISAFLIAGYGIWTDLDAGVETDVETFMPQDTRELEDIHRLRDIVGTTDQVSIVYEGTDVLSEESLAWTHSVTNELDSEFPDEVIETNSITSVLKKMNEGDLPKGDELSEQIDDMPDGQLKLLINEDRSKGVINVGIKHLEAQQLQEFISELRIFLEDRKEPGLETAITGKAVLDAEMVTALTTGRYKMTLLGMGLVFLGLLLIYRHPVKAFIPLLPIILIVGWSGLAMAFLDIKYTPLTATLGALIIGIGTEFTVLIMERYYEERKKGLIANKAVEVANQKIGKAIFASALTTIGGFSALLVSDFVILSNFGLMTLINITLALISTLVVMPAILIILDRFVKIKSRGKNDLKVTG